MSDLPSVSVVMPTLNSEKTLDKSLASIKEQDYPAELVEIVIADGGSVDKTLKIASKYKAKVCNNHLKTGEAGKAQGARKAKNQIVALIDSDNILPEKKWLRKMVAPFEDDALIASEPLYFHYDKKDTYINRYCSLLGMNDPMCFFTGNYDRYSYLSGRWTDIDVEQKDSGPYIRIKINGKRMPTFGANGFLIRRNVLKNIGDYLFDIDVLTQLRDKNSGKNIEVAKVKTAIAHLYCGSLRSFIFKQRRRIRDYNYFQKKGMRAYHWGANKLGIAKFSLYCLIVLPLLFQSIRGFLKKPDRAWFFHPLACVSTFLIYSIEFTGSKFRSSSLKRDGWQT